MWSGVLGLIQGWTNKERSVRERQGPDPSLGTCSISLTRNLPAVFPLSPPIESLPSILCHLPGPPAQIPFPHPPMEVSGSYYWSPFWSRSYSSNCLCLCQLHSVNVYFCYIPNDSISKYILKTKSIYLFIWLCQVLVAACRIFVALCEVFQWEHGPVDVSCGLQ